MKNHAFVKFSTVIAMSCFITACSNNPKVVEPSLGAASAAPAEIVNTPRGPSLTLKNVLFDFEESGLRSEAYDTVSKAVTYLQANPERKALVEGHTDHTGPELFNQMLSQQRSESVKNALIDQGIAAARIQTKGLGESTPIADNASLSGRQANRRVEILFVK